jgi:hypothetical protein
MPDEDYILLSFTGYENAKRYNLNLSVSRSRSLAQNNNPHAVESVVGATFSESSSVFCDIGWVSLSNTLSVIFLTDDKTSYESPCHTSNIRNFIEGTIPKFEIFF